MTIQMQHLTVDADASSWLTTDDGRDVRNDETLRFDLLSMVRHIMRERSDANMIPVVVGARLLDTPNRWGHNLQVEVQYHTRGYRAIYAGRTGGTLTDVQCYMD